MQLRSSLPRPQTKVSNKHHGTGGFLHPARLVSTLRPASRVHFKGNDDVPEQLDKPAKVDWRKALKEQDLPDWPEAKDQPYKTSQQFSWTKHWYAVAVLEKLDLTVPHQVTLMSTNLALWHNPVSGQWSCMEDRCPHRAGPLSQGQIVKTSGQLRCAYHGWTFDTQGNCTDVPSSANPERICSMKKSCAITRPCVAAHGLLWVWGEGGPEAHIEAAAAKPPGAEVEPLNSPEWWVPSPWFERLPPVSLEAQMDNYFDPAHGPFVHHGMVGMHRDKAVRGYSMTQHPTTDVNSGFHLTSAPAAIGSEVLDVDLTYRPPGTYVSCYPMSNGAVRAMITMRTPVSPGMTKNLTLFAYKSPTPAIKRFATSLPVFAQHLFSLNFGDPDFLLQHEQDRIVERLGGQHKVYFVPDPTDLGIKVVLTWLRQAGPIPYAGGSQLPPRMSRDQILDHWGQHVRDCPYCRRGLVMVRAVAALAATAAVVAAWAAASGRVWMVGGWVGAALLAGLSWVMVWYQRQFFTGDIDLRKL